jgi:hypothetical protein
VGKEIAFVLIIYPKHSISIKSAELEPIINYYPIALLIWVHTSYGFDENKS